MQVVPVHLETLIIPYGTDPSTTEEIGTISVVIPQGAITCTLESLRLDGLREQTTDPLAIHQELVRQVDEKVSLLPPVVTYRLLGQPDNQPPVVELDMWGFPDKAKIVTIYDDDAGDIMRLTDLLSKLQRLSSIADARAAMSTIEISFKQELTGTMLNDIAHICAEHAMKG